MARNKINLEWYVLNDNGYTSDLKVEPFNIFNNSRVKEWVVEACEDFKKGKYSFNEFKQEIKSAFMNQFWARCQYEIQVTSWPELNQFIEESFEANQVFEPKWEVEKDVFHDPYGSGDVVVYYKNTLDTSDTWKEFKYGLRTIHGIKYQELNPNFDYTVRYVAARYRKNFTKIDVWDQIEPNLDTVCKYILDTYFPKGWEQYLDLYKENKKEGKK